ncbi:MAG: hypothetical protein WBQ60_10610 [Asticcacaulis sp.]
MLIKTKVPKLLQISAFVMLSAPLQSCSQRWDVTIIGTESGQPVFCFSHTRKCSDDDPGIQFGNVTVREVDTQGIIGVQVWSITYDNNAALKASDKSNAFLKRVTYGKAPSFWGTDLPPQPLISGHAYAVGDGQYVFYKTLKGTFGSMPYWDFEHKYHFLVPLT